MKSIQDLLDNTGQRSSSFSVWCLSAPDGKCWKCVKAPSAPEKSVCFPCWRWMRGEDVLAP